MKTKVCSLCKNEKSLLDFSKKKDKYTSRCKKCNNEYFYKWYNKNKDTQIYRMKEVNKVRREEIRTFLCEFLATHPCVDCKNSNVLVLDFDHLTDKKFDISKAQSKGYSLEKIKLEIAKCEVRCANCHRIKTHKSMNSHKMRFITNIGQRESGNA